LYGSGYSLDSQMLGRVKTAVATTANPAVEYLGTVPVQNPASGSLDLSFGIGGKLSSTIGGSYYSSPGQFPARMVVQSDGKIVVLTTKIEYISSPTPTQTGSYTLIRYNPNGSLDTSFGTGGKTTITVGNYCVASSLAIQTDGKIVVGGYTYITTIGSTSSLFLTRHNTNASLDTSFDTDGIVTTAGIGSGIGSGIGQPIELQADGKIVLLASGAVLRYNPNGSLDTSFDTDGVLAIPTVVGISDYFTSIATQTDGKIIIAGYEYNAGAQDFVILRFLTNGALDTSFGTGGKVKTDLGSNSELVYAIKIQADGKIVLAGGISNQTSPNPPTSAGFAMVRYNVNGTLDTSFDTDGIVTTYFSQFAVGLAIEIRADGQIFLGGTRYTIPTTQISSYNSSFILTKYNSNGSLNTSFGTNGEVTTKFSNNDYLEFLSTVAFQPDGKLLAAGSISFVSYSSTTPSLSSTLALARYLP
jgi:uncharacterized delta-60 repeat protein